MNKRLCILFFCFITIGNLIFGETSLNNDYVSLLPVDNVIPGITKVDDIKDRGKFSQYSDGSGGLIENYRLNGSTVYFEKDTITKTNINKNFALPEHWRTLGLNWEMDFYGWIQRFTDLGFNIQVISYPVFSIKMNWIYLSGRIHAVHPDEPEFLYNIEFHSSTNDPKRQIKSLVRNVTIQMRDKTESFIENWTYPQNEEITLAEFEREAIAFSGLLGGVNRSYQEKLESFDLNEEKEKGKALDILSNSWDIESAEELIDTLNQLREGGHSASMIELLNIIESQPDKSLLDYAISNNLDEVKTRRLIFLSNFSNLPGLRERSLKAWDYGRSISLCRWGYTAGFLSESEAWDLIFVYRNEIVTLYNSWEDYAANYLLGRMFWSRTPNNKQYRANEIFKVYIDLSNREGSIWKDSWIRGANIIASNDFYTKINEVLYLKSKDEQALEHYSEGLKFFNAGLYEDAKEEFIESQKKQEDFFTPNVYLGFCERNLNSIGYAVPYFKKYYDFKPQDYFATLYYGEASEDLGSFDSAIFILNKAIQIAPEKPYAYKSIARIYLNKKDFLMAQKILNDYDNFVEDDDKSYYADYLKGSLAFKQKEYERSITNLQKCYQEYNKNGYFNYLLGSCYLFKDDRELDISYTYLLRAEKMGIKLPENIIEFLRIWENENENNTLEPLV